MREEVLLELDPDEQSIASIQRHPISVFYILVVAGTLFVMAIAALFFGLKYSTDIGLDNYKGLFTLIMTILVGLIFLFTWVAIYLDRKNQLIVTNENIIQVLQFGLFNKQVSQLNLAKIQDVSVDQNGPIATIFNFGVLEVETAGEAANFRFIYIPNPNVVAKTILEAHEDYTERVASSGGKSSNL